jgi:hypothetical protein
MKENKEQQIARALFMMCILPEETGGSTSKWDPAIFMLAVRESFPNIDFGQVLMALDFAHFTIKSPAAAEALFAAFKAVIPVHHLPILASSLQFRISMPTFLSSCSSVNGPI